MNSVAPDEALVSQPLWTNLFTCGLACGGAAVSRRAWFAQSRPACDEWEIGTRAHDDRCGTGWPVSAGRALLAVHTYPFTSAIWLSLCCPKRDVNRR